MVLSFKMFHLPAFRCSNKNLAAAAPLFFSRIAASAARKINYPVAHTQRPPDFADNPTTPPARPTDPRAAMPPRLPLRVQAPFASAVCTSLKPAPRRLFQSTPRRADDDDSEEAMRKSVKELEYEKMKEEYFAWLAGPGENFKKPLMNETNYLGSYDLRSWSRKEERGSQFFPFPLNPYYKANTVLSDELKEIVYDRVVNKKRTIRGVSAELSISLERVAAVVRLKTIEKNMIKEVCGSGF